MYLLRDHMMLKVQFRPGVGGDRLQPLISNCDLNTPSVAIIYDNVLNEVILMLQTVNDTGKELRFKVNVSMLYAICYTCLYYSQVNFANVETSPLFHFFNDITHLFVDLSMWPF
jgi:hypothetical protein